MCKQTHTITTSKKAYVAGSLWQCSEWLEHGKRLAIVGGKSSLELHAIALMDNSISKWNYRSKMTPTPQPCLCSQLCSGMQVGMAHRGRLNVLCGALRKASGALFREMEGQQSEFHVGDVKYHLGSHSLLTFR